MEKQRGETGPSGRKRISRHIGPLLLWTLIWAFFFLTLLLGKERLPSSDFSGQYHAFGVFQAQEMSEGRLPLWSPGSYGGFPFAADTQASTFYPLRWLTILLSLPWGFSYYALELEAVLHLWLAGLFTYALSYHMSGQRLGALVSAIAFGLGGYLTSFPLLQVTILETFSWLPLVLLLIRFGVRGSEGNEIGRSIRYLVGAGLVLGVSFLAGHPQAFLYCAYLTAAYFLFLALRANWSWRSIMGLGGVLGGTVLGIAAVSLIPAAHLATYTTRSDVSYNFLSGGSPLLNYLQLLVPGSFSFWIPEYVGLAPFILALFALGGRKHLGAGKGEVYFWIGAAVVAGWLALGDSGVLFQLAYRTAPGFSLFRQQERLLVVVGLALSLLAGQGAGLWFRLGLAERRHLLLKVGRVVGVGMAFAAVVLLFGSPFFDPDWRGIWLRQAILLVPIFGLLWSSRQQRGQLVVLILLLGVDLYLATYEGMDRQTGSPEVYWPEPTWLQDLQEELAQEPLSRIDSRNLFHANIGPIYNLEDMHGISPLKLAWLADFERLPQVRRMELMGVSYILTYDQPETPSVKVGEIDEGLIPGQPLRANIYRVDDFQPRAWMIYKPQVVESPEAAWAVLADLEFDSAAKVVLHTPIPQLETIAQPERLPVVGTIRPSANTLDIAVETAAPGLLVIGEWRYPGWQATLDGEDVALYPANYALQAVFVPAGNHTVQLRFRPFDVVAGGIVSILTLAAAAFFVFGRWPAAFTRSIPMYRKRIPIPTLPDIREKLPAVRISLRNLDYLLPIMLLAFFLRVHQLGLQELRVEEALSYRLTAMPQDSAWLPGFGLADSYNLLQHLLLRGWVGLVGESEFAMRYLTLVPAILVLPLLYQFGRRLAGKKASLLLVLFFSSSQSLVWLSQDIQSQYMWAILFLLLAMFALIRVIKRPNLGRWLIYLLLLALAFYSHYYALFVLAGHGLFLTNNPKRRRLLAQWLAAGTGAVVLFLPWLGMTFREGVKEVGQPVAENLARYLTTVGREMAVGPAFEQRFGIWLFVGAAFVAAFGWRSLRRKRPDWAALLGGWIGAMALGIFLVSYRRATFNPFFIALAAPAWWLLVGVGLQSLWQKRGSGGPWLAVFVTIPLLVGSGLSLTRYYGDPTAYGRSTGIRPLAAHIAEAWHPDDIVLVNGPNPVLEYYLRDVPDLELLELPLQETEQPEIEELLAELSRNYARLWFLPSIKGDLDGESAAYGWLDYHTLVEESVGFDTVSLVAFRPSHAVDEVMVAVGVRPVGVELNGSLAMVGYYVTLNGRPLDPAESIAVEAGDELAVTLIWDSLDTIVEDYSVFVHLLGEDGSLIAQHDGTPLFGTRPTSSWMIGERLLDRHVIEISAEMGGRNGRLVAGMYLVDETGMVVRQQFDNNQDAIWLR